MVTEAPIQVIRDKAANRSGQEEPPQTIGSVTYIRNIAFLNTFKYTVVPDADIPPSFFQGLSDCAAGRTVDVDIAMSQAPADRAVSV